MHHRLVRIMTVLVFGLLVGITDVRGEEQAPLIAADVMAISPTTFPFQGVLRNGSSPVNGSCDLRFMLYDAASGGNRVGPMVETLAVNLVGGIFTVQLDFGAVFSGAPRWLETLLRCPAGSGSYLTLSPRQVILATPYALMAEQAKSAQSGVGDFTATGTLKSARAFNGNDGGALILENTTSGNQWYLPVRGTNSDNLEFHYWNQQVSAWNWAASLGTDGQFWLKSGLSASGAVVTENLLRSAAESDGFNGGALELENVTSGNKWQIPIRAENGDSLDFNFWSAVQQQWVRPGRLEKEGNLVIERKTPASGSLITLEYPAGKWYFHVDPAGHPEIGVYDSASQTTHWDVLDIHPAYGHVGIGGNASPDFNLTVFGPAAISTGDSDNTTLLQFHHPKSHLYVHVDAQGHPEVAVRNVATGQTRWNVLDIDPVTGHIGIGEDASAGDRLRIFGSFTATGTKAATVDTGAYGQRKFYAVEAADVRFSDEGMGQLVEGEARIDLDPIFMAAVEQPYLIQVTPYASAALYVAEVGADYFTVALHTGAQDAQFAWRLSAPRRGYADVRLEAVEAQPEGARP